MKHDNAEHQPVEKMTGIRLALIEYAATHTIDELILQALDKIGELVDSAIGFFHFVEADQKTLSLQQWSTRTLNDFCRTESKGLHHQPY
jgi:two-component system, cell cycle sensor histidine kinase and response regulator CckA